MKIYAYKCESCGSKQYVKTKNGYKCKYCGSLHDVITEDSANNIEVSAPATNNKPLNSKVETVKTKFTPELRHALLMFFSCYFMGVLGVHKFIERKIGKGILYLCTWGLFGIGWLIDIVKLGINLAVEIKAAKLDWGK